MKKSKLSITLVTSFIAAMALTACNEVSSNKEAIVTFKPYGSSEKVDVITNDIYNQYRNTSDGINKFYNKILEVLIRNEFENKETSLTGAEMKYSEIVEYAKNEVKEQKSNAKKNASSNGTKYEDEWESILKSNNVENEEGLREKFIYEKEKEVITDWYADNTENAGLLKKEFIGVNDDGTAVVSDVKAAMPYHIRHILVKVDESSDAQAKFYRGTISESQAKLLADTVKTLADGKYTFSQVASMYSEDTSASSGGDVGIMTNKATSGSLEMVSEFQLGLYAFDNLYNATNTTSPAAQAVKNGLGLGDGTKAAEYFASNYNEITEVPYQAFVRLGNYAKVTADDFGNQLADGKEALYPRNIMWNKYLNLHNVFVITNKTIAPSHFGGSEDQVKSEFTTLVSDALDTDAPTARFNSDGYLVDENDNVIVGVRSEYGIHFMIIEKSMYDTNLTTYYDTLLPTDDNYVEDSYVGFIQSSSIEDYKTRADAVKSKITSFDATYDYRLYTWLCEENEGSLEFEGAAEGLGELIDNYIKVTKENNAFKQEDGLEKVWRTYTELLDVQAYNRTATYKTKDAEGTESMFLCRLVSEEVADTFYKIYLGNGSSADYAKFNEGGDYYYYAK